MPPVMPVQPPPTGYEAVGEVQLLTGRVRADGTAIFQYVGLANAAVLWALMVGGGTLTPFDVKTDPSGRCSCRYDAEGYSGPLQVGVLMVAQPILTGNR